MHISLLLWRYNSDSLGLLDNILLFKAVLYLFFPLHKLHLLQIIPDIIFPSGLGLPAGLPVNSFHLCILFTMLVQAFYLCVQNNSIVGLYHNFLFSGV